MGIIEAIKKQFRDAGSQLKMKWDMGAQQGKDLKKKHKEVLKKKEDKNGKS